MPAPLTTVALVVGDDSLRDQLAEALGALALEHRRAATVESGLKLLEEGGFDVLFTDLCLPNGVGFELLERGKSRFITILLGAVDELQADEMIMKYEVTDFLSTPIDRKDLQALLRSLQTSGKPKGRNGNGAQDAAPDQRVAPAGFGSMVGRSPAMWDVFERIQRIGPSSAPVLITGESGTGKELVARSIHDLSARRGAFVAVNCGAISPTLMESELFGHEKGSFTGASRAHRGFFERAHLGTLFLDEITEMPPELQVKLLRVLERSRVLRIGSEKHREVNVRVLAATNRPPESAIQEGKLRQDLYYRLKVLYVTLPPLHERDGDIRLLAQHFLADVIEREGRPRELSEAALAALEQYHWPGNARELRNAVYTAYLLCSDDIITPDDLPPEVSGDGKDTDDATDQSGISLRVGESIDEAERRLILTTLAHMDGNKTQAAEVLGISVKTLYNRLHEYGLMGDGSEDGARA